MPKIIIDTGSEIHEPKEAARLLGIGYATLYRWIKLEKIHTIHIAGRTLIPHSEIKRLKSK